MNTARGVFAGASETARIDIETVHPIPGCFLKRNFPRSGAVRDIVYLKTAVGIAAFFGLDQERNVLWCNAQFACDFFFKETVKSQLLVRTMMKLQLIESE